jgi:ParB family protein of integrating conjugative element (PFGI_1 class)
MMVEPAIREPLSLREHGAVPDDARLLRLEVTQLRAYDRNPRRCQNNEYDRIKASIRAQGLDQPLVVTCRPGERDYMLLSGGNTRLQAITDLYQETCDEAFRYLDCFFVNGLLTAGLPTASPRRFF